MFAWSQNAPESTAARVFTCRQSEVFNVTPGWSRFVIRGSIGKATSESDKIRSCAIKAAEQMQIVCEKNPGDYDILAMQILETCCKRARVGSESKFECAAVVLEDLSESKFEI
ncbi:hypothetical protein FGB62_46g010 [Gracilaria domingensis]|nr:hypothetical protein FGB62_46g010 [Gracilaria domingensis]